jgi:predicted component of type VI protein secretion system
MQARSIATFIGEPQQTMDRRLSRLSYLFWTKERSALGLEAVITAFFRLEVRIQQYRTFWDTRCDIATLGVQDLRLGSNSLLGSKIPLTSFGVGVEISHDNYERLFQLLTDNNELACLKRLINKYLGAFYNCRLSITPKNVPYLELGVKALLGRTTWLPSTATFFDTANI